MKMEGVELVVAKNGEEEVGERRNQPREDAVLKEGVEGATQGSSLAEPTWSVVSPPSLLLSVVTWSTVARCFSSARVDAHKAGLNQEA